MNNHEQFTPNNETNSTVDLEEFPFLDFSLLEDPELSQSVRSYLYELRQHPESQRLPENPYSTDNSFDAYPAIEEVGKRLGDISTSDGDVIKKVDFLNDENPNLGWKLHLNVAPDSVIEAARYLVGHDYYFKYMAGPLGGHKPQSPGKIFTIYTGSYAKTKEVAALLAQDMAELLSKPEAVDEVEFAPGVVGRFNAVGENFTQYGPAGFVMNQGFVNWLSTKGVEPPYSSEIAERLELRSVDMLLQKFGNYFMDTEKTAD